MAEEYRGTEPVDRLTRLCAAMTDALDAHDENGPDVRAIVFLGDETRGGIQIHNYAGDDIDDAQIEAMTDLFLHLKAMFRSMGKDLILAPVVQNNPEMS